MVEVESNTDTSHVLGALSEWRSSMDSKYGYGKKPKARGSRSGSGVTLDSKKDDRPDADAGGNKKKWTCSVCGHKYPPNAQDKSPGNWHLESCRYFRPGPNQIEAKRKEGYMWKDGKWVPLPNASGSATKEK